MRRSPAFTAVAVLSLALGIGANTAIFSLIHTLMFRRMPVRAPAQLVELIIQYPGEPPGSFFSLASYEYYRDHNHVLSALSGVHRCRFHVGGGGLEAEVVDGECVTGNFFGMLGVRPALGRLVEPEDDRVGQADSAVAVLSWSYWKNRFNLDPAVLGKSIVVEGVPVTIIGVAPRDFFGLRVGARTDIWVPLAVQRLIDPGKGIGGLALVGRLKPGVSIGQARAELAVLFRFTLEERAKASPDPLLRRLKFTLEPAGAGLYTELRDRFAGPLAALMAAVALLLLIACANVAGMLLARGAARRREMALRVALGAGRSRLLRQLLTESLLLSAAGGLLGVFLAYFGASVLVRIMASGRFIGGPPHIPVRILPDAQVLLFTAGIALLTAVLFGLVPAWSAFASHPACSLRDAGRAGETRSRRRLGKGLVVAQVALSVGLLSAAGLFLRNLSNLERADLGFRRGDILLMTLDPARSGSSGEQLSFAYQDVLGRLETIPGVESATICAPTPLSGAGASRFVSVAGHPERPEDRRYVSVSWIAPKYFETLGTPLLAGRDFSFADRARPRVAIINDRMVRYYFPGRNPIGEYVAFDGDPKPYQIVGVAGDARYYEIREAAQRIIYLNTFQSSRPASTFALRTSGDPLAVAPTVRRSVREWMKDVPVVRLATLSEQVDATIVPERLIAMLSGVFGALGALLAAIGIYGLLAYTVARRAGEIGVRIALGATRTAISRMVLREALGITCAGLLLGVPLAYWGRSLATGLVHDPPVTGAFPIALGAVGMVTIALAAAYTPARRAARVDPIEALRCE